MGMVLCEEHVAQTPESGAVEAAGHGKEAALHCSRYDITAK